MLLRALTLTEVLVVMLIAGILFLSVMEGMWLFRRQTDSIVTRITRNLRFYEGYYRLEDIITSTDSIASIGGDRILCRKSPSENITLFLCDSVLIANYRNHTDTLFTRVERLQVIKASGQSRVDTLCLLIREGNDPWAIKFPVQPSVTKAPLQQMEEIEQIYGYH